MATDSAYEVVTTECENRAAIADDDPVAPMIARSLEAFRRDLPQLLRTHESEWVAYHGDERLGFAWQATTLHNRCIRRGLKEDEFLVLFVMAETADEDITWSWNV